MTSSLAAMGDAPAIIRRWRNEPIVFARELFGFEPDHWQAEVLRAFPLQDDKHLRVALQSCAGTGKTAILALCLWNFMLCYGDTRDHPKGACVSITKENLRDFLWSELAKWRQQARGGLLVEAFDQTDQRIESRDHPETWFLSARSFPKDADPDTLGRTLSGLHSRYVMFAVDESGKVPTPVLRAAEQARSTADRFFKVMQAGNPLSLDGMLYESVTRLRHEWDVTVVTGDPDEPLRSPRVNATWARQQIENYGRDNPWVTVYILGQFPKSGLNTLLTPDDFEAAFTRTLRPSEYEWSQNRLGLDTARFGDDRTVLFRRQGRMGWEPEVLRGATSQQIATRILFLHQGTPFDVVTMDAAGNNAGGVADLLRTGGMNVIEVWAASTKVADPRYFNVRSYVHFKAAEWVKGGGCLVRTREVVREGTCPTYVFSNGKFRIEEKDSIKERLGESPDVWDAFCQTFVIPDAPGSGSALDGGGVMRAVIDRPKDE